MRERRRRGGRIATALLGLTAATAACGEVVPVEEFERTSGVAAPAQPAPTRREEVGGTGTGGFPSGIPSAPAEDRAGAPLGFGDGVRVVEAAMARLPGERTLVQVVLYEGYGTVTSRAASGDVDAVVVRSGGAEKPTAVPSITVRDPEGQRFAVDDVDWGAIPTLVERTPGDLGIDGGLVSHVIVEKNVPFSPDLVIRVYVSTERRSGRIDYFADGRPMRAFPG